MRQLWDQLGEFWCTTMHSSVMWPRRGRYQCAVCLREYPVPFEPAKRPARRDEPFAATVALRRV